MLLTPGIYNSAYYEHRSWPTSWGSNWSRAATCREDDMVYMRTTQGPQRVDVIYRRIDDDFLDPLAFRPNRPWASPD